jgi:hypothetical protein
VPATGTQTFVAITAVPEPSTLVLLAVAVAVGLAALARRRGVNGSPVWSPAAAGP